MLVEIYPPSVSVAGLQTALQDLIAPLRAQGIEASADTPVSVDLPLDVESLVFRVAQESLRNVAEHSGARRASLTLTAEAGRAVLEICDDGTGLDVEQAVNRRDGHVGMQVLRDLCHDAGALLEIASAPGRGTRIRLEVASL
jgi:signal transduction histidine kinase